MKKLIAFLFCFIMISGVLSEEQIQYPEIYDGYGLPKYSPRITIIEDTSYYSMWSGLFNSDAEIFFRDMTILQNSDIKKLRIYLNSHGGYATVGLDVSDRLLQLRSLGIHITIEASGNVMSAAIPILVVANHRVAQPSCLFMIHKGSLFEYYLREKTSDVLKAQQNMLDLQEQNYLRRITNYTKLSEKQYLEYNASTTWFDAKQALEWGFIDEIIGEKN